MNDDSGLISRNEAKKLGATCLARRNENGQLEAIISLDNAPTVPLPDFKDGYKQAILDGKTNYSRPEDNIKETTFDDYLKEQLKDPEFRKEWEKLNDEEKGGAE